MLMRLPLQPHSHLVMGNAKYRDAIHVGVHEDVQVRRAAAAAPPPLSPVNYQQTCTEVACGRRGAGDVAQVACG